MSPWLSVAIGLGVQALMLAFFFGVMRTEQKNTRDSFAEYQKTQEKTIKEIRDSFSTSIDKLVEQMHEFTKFATDTAMTSAKMDMRFQALERNTEGLANLRESLSASNATATAERKELRGEMEKLGRFVERVDAKVANMVSGQANTLKEILPR